jgi:hypothetical protein
MSSLRRIQAVLALGVMAALLGPARAASAAEPVTRSAGGDARSEAAEATRSEATGSASAAISRDWRCRQECNASHSACMYYFRAPYRCYRQFVGCMLRCRFGY